MRHVRKVSGLSQKPHHTLEGRGGLWLHHELIQGSDDQGSLHFGTILLIAISIRPVLFDPGKVTAPGSTLGTLANFFSSQPF